MRGIIGMLTCLMLAATGTGALAQGIDSSTPSVRVAYLKESPDSPGHGYPLITFPYPFYPMEFARVGIGGFVEARLEVGTDGHVRNVTVLKSSHKEFEPPTLWAARRWRFVEIPNPETKQKAGLIIQLRLEFYFEDD